MPTPDSHPRPGGADSAASTASSNTLAAPADSSQEQESTMHVDDAPEPTEGKKDEDESALDKLSPEERKRAKGKGKATDAAGDDKMDDDDGSELTRLKKELATKDELIAAQLAVLSSLHGSVACTVCLETLDKPYSLGCGHVFCRKCLLNWFFRPDPAAEAAAEAAAAEDDSDGSTSTRSRSSSSSSSSSSGSGSARSLIGGTLAGRDFTVTGLRRGESGAAFDAMAERMYGMLEEAAAGGSRSRGRGELGGAGAGAGAAEGGGRQRSLLEFVGEAGGAGGSGRFTELDDGAEEKTTQEKEEEVEPERPLSPSALRQARLARFGITEASKGDVADVEEEKDDAPPAPAEPPTTTSRHFPSTAPPAPPARSPSPPPRPASAAPSDPAPEPPLGPTPTGAHRLANLICPQCRTSCAEKAPARVFVLDEVLGVLRRAGVGEDGSLAGPSSAEKGKGRAKQEKEEEKDDPSWRGLFPSFGAESKADRKRRLAQMVEDREDGVRRCGECNWEIDERSGVCEGCGRTWSIPPSSSRSSTPSSYDPSFAGLRGPTLPWSRRHG
ncbi:hypothetical protein JCM8097_004114, partial [Rhodosporidiobolus ruineniae]